MMKMVKATARPRKMMGSTLRCGMISDMEGCLLRLQAAGQHHHRRNADHQDDRQRRSHGPVMLAEHLLLDQETHGPQSIRPQSGGGCISSHGPDEGLRKRHENSCPGEWQKHFCE